MSPHSQSQNQALVILTIATAAIGFGLFGVEFRTGGILLEYGMGPFLSRLKLGFGLVALIYYAAVLASVMKVLMQDDDVTSRQLVTGPLLRMYIEIAYIALIFVVGVFEEPVPNQQ